MTFLGILKQGIQFELWEACTNITSTEQPLFEIRTLNPEKYSIAGI